MKYTATLNIANRVRNIYLPRTKPLQPLFELISNSIHSIEEAINEKLIDPDDGKIEIECIRNGSEETLKSLQDIDTYPIYSFTVKDNGLGLNNENFKAFTEPDTDRKIEIGGKGIGRLVCLKAFKEMNVLSFYQDDNVTKGIQFDLKPTREGFHNYSIHENGDFKHGTLIKLNSIKEDYQKHLPKRLMDIAIEVVSHFQLYFIKGSNPRIIVRNQNDIQYDLATIYRTEFRGDVRSGGFLLGDFKFELHLTKSIEYQSHKINFCAHNRSVKSEGLFSRIVDLGKKPIEEDGSKFYYQAHVVSDILDNSVDTERVSFTFPDGEEDEDSKEINLAKIRSASIECIEELLAEYLQHARKAKIDSYRPIIDREMPQYKSTLHFKQDEVKKLPPDLSEKDLDIELYKIDSTWRLEVKQQKNSLLSEEKDITNREEYREKYEKFLSDFNEIGQSDLARYVVHRKTIIEMLELLIETDQDGKFENEDLIHSIFFPIRSTSEEVPYEKQNLWLIDERLTYHSFLASDKAFKSIDNISSNSNDRSDLLIYNEAFAFSDSKYAPHNTFTIVELKRPHRDDYKDYDPKKNPIEQTENYINLLLEGKVKGRNGRTVEVDDKTPFYVYIICDITPSLLKILKNREFDRTPDGKGWYKLKNRYQNAYIEVMPFEKVLDDAKKRNRILFEKLNID